MSGLSREIKKLFGTENLYDVLGIQRSASKSEVKKGYYKTSLVVHPDRVGSEDSSTATKKFQALAKVYSILSDDEKRSAYDETGCIDEDSIEQTADWNDYWRLLFPKVDVDAIDRFEVEYKGSSEELECIKDAYLRYEGDMGKILETVLCSTIGDEPRFREIIENLIGSNELPEFDAFVNESTEKRTTRKRKAEKEEALAKKASEKKKDRDTNKDLHALILSNQKSRQESADDFIRQMELKYGSSAAKSGKKASGKQPSKSGKK